MYLYWKLLAYWLDGGYQILGREPVRGTLIIEVLDAGYQILGRELVRGTSSIQGRL